MAVADLYQGGHRAHVGSSWLGMTATNFDKFSNNYGQILDESIALSGDGSEYFAEYKAVYASRVSGPLADRRILDFGCGVGLLAGFLKKHFPQSSIHGFDVSESSLKKIPE